MIFNESNTIEPMTLDAATSLGGVTGRSIQPQIALNDHE